MYSILKNDMVLFDKLYITIDKNNFFDKDELRGYSPLYYACSCNKLDFVKKIILLKKELKEKVSVDDINDCDGSTCLIIAVSYNQYEMAKYLIFEGANVNIKNNHHKSSLIISCSLKYFNIIELLLINNADINVRNVENETLLISAIKNNNIEVVKLLIKYNINVNIDDALMIAIRLDRTEIVLLIIDAGADKEINIDYYTPLMQASRLNNLIIVKKLLKGEKYIDDIDLCFDSFYDMNIPDYDYNFYRKAYYTQNSYKLPNKIIRKANINTKTMNDPLNVSISIEVSQFLLENGADINSLTCYGYNALATIIANGNCNIKLILFYISKKIEIDVDFDSLKRDRIVIDPLVEKIINNVSYYYFKEVVKNHLSNKINHFDFLYDILENDIVNVIYVNPLKIYSNGKFYINKDDIKYFLILIKRQKFNSKHNYVNSFINMITN